MSNSVDKFDNKDFSVITPGQEAVSFQVLQDVYASLTRKNETLSKSYRQQVQVEIDDLMNLDHKIRQTSEQYNIEFYSTSIIVSHVDDSSEKYTSFERFRLHSQSHISPVQRLNIEYDFLIQLPKIDKPQSFKINISILSRVGIDYMTRQHSEMVGEVMALLTQNIVDLDISYADYSTASSFLACIDKWTSLLKSSKLSRSEEFMKRKSNYIHPLGRIFSILIIAIVSIFYINILDDNSFLNIDFLNFIVIFTSLIALVQIVTGFIANSVASNFRTAQPLSFVNITKGDSDLIEKWKIKRSFHVRKRMLAIFGMFLFNVLSGIASALIYSELLF